MTKVYGRSDDIITFKGDINGEVGAYDTRAGEGVMLIFSDSTILDIYYEKGDLAIWGITIIKKGDLFDSLEPCTDEDAEIHSDVATFKPGLKWCYAGRDWEKVK